MSGKMSALVSGVPFEDFDSIRTLKIITSGDEVQLQAEFEDDDFKTIESFTEDTLKTIHLMNGQRYQVILPTGTKAKLSNN
jgi:hypothetical protein